MRTVHAYKAQESAGEPVKAYCLMLDEELPQLPRSPDWRQIGEQQHDANARRVVDVLCHLPGGTLDRVLGLLLSMRASLFSVPLYPVPGGEVDTDPDKPASEAIDLMDHWIARFGLLVQFASALLDQVKGGAA